MLLKILLWWRYLNFVYRYINGLLIPEIHVVRGKTYTFVVEGGQDPEFAAGNPFHFTHKWSNVERGFQFSWFIKCPYFRLKGIVKQGKEGVESGLNW
jgi:hypothetical protein